MIPLVHTDFNVAEIRKHFPILNQTVNGRKLVYLDNAATSQKPLRVINALSRYYEGFNSNIHRGIHTLAEKATHAFEETRDSAMEFINAKQREEIIFTSGVTASINLVASSYGRTFFNAGDEIIISGLEHHSNIVPWQLIAKERKAIIKVIPVLANGELDLVSFENLISSKTKLVTLNHASNSLGTINPVKKIVQMAHTVGAVALIDGAQAGAHLEIDVQDLDCDFYCLAAHKMYGPTGVGILYGKRDLLEAMPPYMGGGEMIKNVSFNETTFNDLPYKFEAGTPNIADVVALKEAISFVNEIGKEAIAAHEHELLRYTSTRLTDLSFVKLIGTAPDKVGVQSFLVSGIHPFDVGQMLDARGIAVRTGHHCTQPLMESFGIEGTVRASFAVYNTNEEVDLLIEGVERIAKFLN